MVMHLDATLPDRCVKTNLPAHGKRLKRNLTWHHPAWYLLVLLNLFIYVLVAICIRKQAKLQLGVSEHYLKKRTRLIASAWVLFLAGILMLFVGLTDYENYGALSGIGMVSCFASMILGVIAGNVVTPTLIQDDLIWLKGVHPDYLATLPDWTGM